ncbi:RTX-I toxin determinant A from serotypes 1/9 [Aquimixticola soesokkakensis]|uniref:RTX-I toxin determinant A from serotypes 1/9 n=1 Tax=Aquimixticola soesokkakensis TaxID=1519096 RepID=A0A1Y5TS54_9RHOB|nr:calcium-binding protein [Aquimixticola soesokkakensis]SLN68350.1 RTX-I toxin determinant A from serotypes 1/9 [Aquimixticola soesokkakensis]
MLWALLLLGMLPVALMPDVAPEQTDDETDDAADLEQASVNSAGADVPDLLDDMSADVDAAADTSDSADSLDSAGTPDSAGEDPAQEAGSADAQDSGQALDEDSLEDSDESTPETVSFTDGESDVYEMDADGSAVEIDGFVAGEDVLSLSLKDGAQGSFSFGKDAGTNDAILSYTNEAGETSIGFNGLSSVPSDDIWLEFTDPESGEDVSQSLSDWLVSTALTPEDGDAIDTPGGTEGEELAIGANDPDAEEDHSDVDTSQDDILTPEPGDAAPSAGNSYRLGDGGETLVLSDDPNEQGATDDIWFDEDAFAFEDGVTFEDVTGGAGNDTIVTGDAAAVVNAGDGDDTLGATDGSAILNGEGGNDTLYGSDGAGSYVLDGGAGNDQIHGGAASEMLIGGAGADVLSGGGGDDSLVMDTDDTATGGAGADSFLLYHGGAADSGHAAITDFTTGEDLLHITYDAPDGAEGTPEITLGTSEDGTGTTVSIDGDLVAVLHNVTNVSAADISASYGAAR